MMKIEADNIKEIIKRSSIELDADKIQSNLPLRGQGIDSLLIMDMLLAIEEAYGVKIPDEDAGNLDTLQSIASYVQGKLDGHQ